MKYRLYKSGSYFNLQSDLATYGFNRIGSPIINWFMFPREVSLNRGRSLVAEFNSRLEVVEYIKKLKLMEELKK